MLTIKTREYPENSLIGKFFDYTYKLSHSYCADPKHKELSERVKELFSQVYLMSVNIYFPELDLVDLRTVKSLSDKKPFVLGKNRIEHYRSTVSKDIYSGIAIEYQKNSYKNENLLVYNQNHYFPVLLSQQDGKFTPGWYIYSQKLEKWISVEKVYAENSEDIVSEKKLTYKFYQFTVDEEIEKEYKRLKRKLDIKNKISNAFYKIFHTIDSIILCVRFPFLYPRNRFTDLHYTNWDFLDYIKAVRQKNSSYMSVRVMSDSSKEFHYNTPMHPAIDTKVEEVDGNKNHTVTTYSIKKSSSEDYVICREEKNNKQRTLQFNVIWCHANQMHTYHPDFGWIDLTSCFKNMPASKLFITHDENGEYSTYHFTYVKNKFTEYWVKFLEWFHEYVLGFIFCIPTSNELDALDTGWKKKFGIAICKEIRRSLIKDKLLFKYRISQIKEKFGTLRWYDNVSTDEIFKIISKYEGISEHTCISCGKPAKYITSGWMCPYCEDCISEKGKLGATVLDETGKSIGYINKDGEFIEKKKNSEEESED